jgi:hypothetical protein
MVIAVSKKYLSIRLVLEKYLFFKKFSLIKNNFKKIMLLNFLELTTRFVSLAR